MFRKDSSTLWLFNILKAWHSLWATGYLVFLIIILNGCGYHVMGRGEKLPNGITTISVPFFENQVKDKEMVSLLKSELGSIMTPPFTEELVNSGIVKVVDRGEAVLKGVIRDYTLTPLSYTRGDVVKEYRLKVVLALSIVKEGKTLWQGELNYSNEFDASDDISTFRANEERALKDVAVELAKQFKERIIEDF